VDGVDAGLYGALSALVPGTVTGVFPDEAPDGQAYPFIVWALVAAPDEHTLTQMAASFLTYQVKVIDEGHAKDDALAALAAAHALLERQPLNAPGHLQTFRVSRFAFTEKDAGATYQHVGANYRIVVGA